MAFLSEIRADDSKRFTAAIVMMAEMFARGHIRE